MTNDERPTGVVVTIREIYENVQELTESFKKLDGTISSVLGLRSNLDTLEGRVRKVEQQNAAHWVVHTIMVGIIAVGAERLFL